MGKVELFVGQLLAALAGHGQRQVTGLLRDRMISFTQIGQDEIFHTDEAKDRHTLSGRNRTVLMSLGIFDLESCVGGTPWDSFSTPTQLS